MRALETINGSSLQRVGAHGQLSGNQVDHGDQVCGPTNYDSSVARMYSASVYAGFRTPDPSLREDNKGREDMKMAIKGWPLKDTRILTRAMTGRAALRSRTPQRPTRRLMAALTLALATGFLHGADDAIARLAQADGRAYAEQRAAFLGLPDHELTTVLAQPRPDSPREEALRRIMVAWVAAGDRHDIALRQLGNAAVDAARGPLSLLRSRIDQGFQDLLIGSRSGQGWVRLGADGGPAAAGAGAPLDLTPLMMEVLLKGAGPARDPAAFVSRSDLPSASLRIAALFLDCLGDDVWAAAALPVLAGISDETVAADLCDAIAAHESDLVRASLPAVAGNARPGLAELLVRLQSRQDLRALLGTGPQPDLEPLRRARGLAWVRFRDLLVARPALCDQIEAASGFGEEPPEIVVAARAWQRYRFCYARTWRGLREPFVLPPGVRRPSSFAPALVDPQARLDGGDRSADFVPFALELLGPLNDLIALRERRAAADLVVAWATAEHMRPLIHALRVETDAGIEGQLRDRIAALGNEVDVLRLASAIADLDPREEGMRERLGRAKTALEQRLAAKP